MLLNKFIEQMRLQRKVAGGEVSADKTVCPHALEALTTAMPYKFSIVTGLSKPASVVFERVVRCFPGVVTS